MPEMDMDGGGGGSVYCVCRAGKEIEEEKKKGERDGMMAISCKGFTGR